jgi:membrane fusion protein (multidrug efflux system)
LPVVRPGSLLLLGGLLLACGGAESVPERPAVRVETSRVESGTLKETVRGIGTLRAAETVEIRAEVAGTVAQIHFEEGGFVQAGQPLYSLDDRTLSSQAAAQAAAVREAQARLSDARSRFDRVKALAESDALSRQEYDRARTELDTARAGLERARAQLQVARELHADTNISAPFSGPISESEVDVGDFVRVGDRLATLYQVSPLEIAFRIPERFADKVRRGQPLELVAASAPAQTFEGSVDFVSPAIDESTRDFLVKALIANEEGALKPGSFATVQVTVEERSGIPVVPEEALIATRLGYQVFVVNDGVAELRPVEIGLREPGRAEVATGLVLGERVVKTGQMRLSSGTQVEEFRAQQVAAPPPEGGSR